MVGLGATVGAVFFGLMVTVMFLVVVPPWPSLTVMVKVSVLAVAGALVAAAAWRAAAVGVEVKAPVELLRVMVPLVVLVGAE